MSEEILKALMQLFALVSSPNQNEEHRRDVVRNYLSQQLNSQKVEEYLAMYDSFVHEQEMRLSEPSKLRKRHAASSVKVLKIATSINEELNYYQKLVVLIQLLEFFNSGRHGMSSVETEFANTISATFNINSSEYLEIFAFITDNFKSQFPGSNLLIISGEPGDKDKSGYFYLEHLQNELRVLNLSSGNLMLLKARKASALTLNGQLIQPGKVYFMRQGSSLRHRRLAPLTYTTIANQFYKSKHKDPILFEVKDISFMYDKSNAGIRRMSFSSGSGNLVGIMGDSGSGKTTLISLLTGMLKPENGSVKINGVDIYNHPEKVKGLIGYVAQDDLLIEDLTVYQNLYYNAKLCFAHISKPNLSRKVDLLLKSLGLYEIRNMKVGNPLNKKISGGQRKRLNIALELIREPAVMFMDEPTSGLSSRDSENIMDLLKELSLKGKLIFVVIHQPSSEIFKMFDQLLVLDTGGRMIYDGEPVEAINYFKECVNHVNKEESECPLCGNVSPEQILTIVNSNVLDEYGNPTGDRKVDAHEWYDLYIRKHKSQQTDASEHVQVPQKLPEVSFKIPNRLNQLWVFITRDVLAKLSNRQYVLINFLESPLLAFILSSLILYFDIGAGSRGYIFSQNPNLTVYIILAVIISIFIGLTVSAEEIISDRKLLRRESFLNLSRFSYLSSKFIILAAISAIQTALFVLIGNTIMGIKDMGVIYWFVLFSSAVFANLLGLNVSDALNKSVNVYILIPFLIIPQLIISGVFVNYDQLNPRISSQKQIPWYGELITARWAFEALAVKQHMDNAYHKHFAVFEKLKSEATFRKDYWIPELNNQMTKWSTLVEESEKLRIESLVRNEIEKHNRRIYQSASQINPLNLGTEPFDTSVIRTVRNTLDVYKTFYINLYNRADELMESEKRRLITEYGPEYLIKLKEEYHNDNLERFLRRTNDMFMSRIVVLDDEIIKKFDPIYTEPEHPFLKAHFLAPVKRLSNNKINTYTVNLTVIWIYNVLLFILLYFEVFRKLLNYGKRIRARKELSESQL